MGNSNTNVQGMAEFGTAGNNILMTKRDRVECSGVDGSCFYAHVSRPMSPK